MKHKPVILLCAVLMLLSACAPKVGTDTAEGGANTGAAAYIGEDLDAETGEAGLEIADAGNGVYTVQIAIFRLTSLSDGVGAIDGDNMAFTATDAAGEPISGVITLNGQTATVTFLNSSWEHIQNGSSFDYIKSSDVPNIWGE